MLQTKTLQNHRLTSNAPVTLEPCAAFQLRFALYDWCRRRRTFSCWVGGHPEIHICAEEFILHAKIPRVFAT